MKKSILLFCILLVAPVLEQNDNVDRLSVPFSNPDKPGLVVVNMVTGSIKVEGYDGKEVVIEARAAESIIDHDHDRDRESDREDRRSDKPAKSTQGMFRIPITSTGLSVSEEGNKMVVEVESWRRRIEVTLRVPRRVDLDLGTVNDGDITVDNVEGNLEISNVNGEVDLNRVAGSVVASTLNGDLRVVFTSIYPDKPMAFTNLNGDVDVTFPATLKADVKMKNDGGEIYSDFQIDIKATPKEVVDKNGREKGGKYRVQIDRTIVGTINGGGPEYTFGNFQGDILIRKAK